MKIQKITVLGSGTMGCGISQVIAQAGYNVNIVEPDPNQIDRAKQAIRSNMDKMILRGKFTEEYVKETISRIHYFNEINFAKESDLVIEAVLEDLSLKQNLFEQLDKILPEKAIITSNTSSMLIREISERVVRKDKVMGTHFFNPVPVMKLVELVCTEQTSNETYNSVKQFCESIGKVTVKAPDCTGFIVNTVLNAVVEAGWKLVSMGVSPQDVDTGMKLGANYPMGPFELMDFCGLDIAYATFVESYEKSGYSEDKKPPEILKKLVEAGHYGKKTGEGFYKYNS